MPCFLCAFKTQSGITLHRFPSNEALRSQWFQACGLGTVEYWKNLKLCAIHFSPDDYNKNRKRNYLKQNIVPSRFLVGKTEPKSENTPGPFTLENISYVNTVHKASRSRKKTSQSLCPLSMYLFEDNFGEYGSKWVCKLCLTTLLSMDDVFKHLKHCNIPLGYTVDSEDDEEDVPFKYLRRL